MTKAPLQTLLHEARVTLPGGFSDLTDTDIEEICEAFAGITEALPSDAERMTLADATQNHKGPQP